MTEFYCMKCKNRVITEDVRKETIPTSRGVKYILKGSCPDCNTKINKFTRGE